MSSAVVETKVEVIQLMAPMLAGEHASAVHDPSGAVRDWAEQAFRASRVQPARGVIAQQPQHFKAFLDSLGYRYWDKSGHRLFLG